MARGYQSVFDLPDPLTGTGSAWGATADPFGVSYDQSFWPADQYAYGYTPREGMGYDPLPQGDPFGSYSTEFGSNVLDAGIEAWLQKEYPELYSGFTWGTQTNPGVIASPQTPKWQNVNRWDNDIRAAVQKVAETTGVFVPYNVVKSIIQIESQGLMPGEPNYAGAAGLMQVTPMSMGAAQYDFTRINTDPAYSIWAGVNELALRFQDAQRVNPEYGWGNAAVGYFSGHYEPTGASDAYNSDHNYLRMFNENMAELGNAAGSGGTAAPGNTQQFAAIWGGFDAPITQEYGMTEFAQTSEYARTAYAYTSAYTRDGSLVGHMGIDVGLSYGTALYSPVAGTVTVAGGSGYYCDVDGNGCGPGVGQLNLTLANGDVIVLGHMSQITLKPGDTVTPGQFVGYSGSENGAHLHVEYRKWVGEGVTASGYEAFDPRLALAGMFTGSFGQAGSGPAQAASAAGDWTSFLTNAAKGLPLTGRMPGVGGFHDWLLQAMGKKPVTVAFASEKPSGWSWQQIAAGATGGRGTLDQTV